MSFRYGQPNEIVNMPNFMSSSFAAFPESKETTESKVVSTSNQWDKAKSNEVSVTFTLSSAAAKVLNFNMTAHHLMLFIIFQS